MVVPTRSQPFGSALCWSLHARVDPQIHVATIRYVRISWRVVRNAPFPAQSGRKSSPSRDGPVHRCSLRLDNDMQINVYEETGASERCICHTELRNWQMCKLFWEAIADVGHAAIACMGNHLRGPRWPAIVPRRHARSAQLSLCLMKPCRPKESTRQLILTC